MKIPENLIKDATVVRTATNSGALTDVADKDDVDLQYNVAKLSFDFSVQPTDDGSKIYAESDDLAHLRDFFSQVIGSALVKPVIDNEQVAQQQTAAAQHAAEVAERNANLTSAKADDQLVNQAITAVWRSINSDRRSTLLPEQRAWIEKKTADCDLEAASSSADPTDKETAKLKCDTRLTQERLVTLRQYAPAPAQPTNLLPN